MRTAFINTLMQLAGEDERIFLLTGDLGFTVFENFRKQYPERFLNIGVAEQNMVGIASGLALSGKIVFIYSIVPFLTMRPFEQIRNDVCYHNLNMKMIGVGGGYSYGVNGPTHHALEDIAAMKALHNMSIICPGDPLEVKGAVKAIAATNGPFYLRLGKSSEPIIHPRPFLFKIGKGIMVKNGKDATIISTGNMLENAMLAANMLKQKAVDVRVISMHTVKPLDRSIILKAAKETGIIVTLEEHSVMSGLGSSVAEVLTESDIPKVLFKKIAAPDAFAKMVGSQKYLREAAGLSVKAIADAVIKLFNKRAKVKKKL